MSTHANDPGTHHQDSGAAEAVRQAFGALPFDQKVSTLLRIELDIMGDVADAIVSTASKVADDIGRAFDRATGPAPGPASPGSQAPTS